MSHRSVFDTNTVVSALLFPNGRLAWLRRHWRQGTCTPLISSDTAAELNRVLGYPKFRLSADDRLELLADYLPYCETIQPTEICVAQCRNPTDQAFLDLTESGGADLLVSGDKDLLALVGQTQFVIETPEAYRRRFS